MYVCLCKAITEQQVRDSCLRGCFTLAHYSKLIHRDGGCGKCIPKLKELINEEKQARTEAAKYYEATSSTG